MKLYLVGDAVAEGTSSKLDVAQPCLQYRYHVVNTVRKTQTWWSILERLLRDWVEENVTVELCPKASSPLEALTTLPQTFQGYVLLLFGSEMFLRGHHPSDRDLERLIELVVSRGGTPVLLTPPPLSERLSSKGFSLKDVRLKQAHFATYCKQISDLASRRALPLIDLYQFFLKNQLLYNHLFEGWLPDGVAQTAMASFVTEQLTKFIGIEGFPHLVLTDYRKIFSNPDDPEWKHHAFTDLTFFKGQFFVAFREGFGHCPPPPPSGRIVILRSEDGFTWEKEAVLQVPGVEHSADPKFLTVDGHGLFVYTPCLIREGGKPRSVTYGFRRLSPGQWSCPFKVSKCVFWRPKKWRNLFVVAPYHWPEEDASVKLLGSPDGYHWRELGIIHRKDAYNNETDLWVEGDRLMAFSRHDPPDGDHYMQISTFIEEENRWETVSSGRLIQAPCVFEAKGSLFVVGRTCAYPHEEFTALTKLYSEFSQGNTKIDPALIEKYHHGLRTGIFVLDGFRARQVAELLSAGDSSYPGVVRYGEEYLISDYSMHEYYPPILKPGDWTTPADIYISRIRIE
ncbi:MAG: hypothetical protein J7M05_06670 [Anaerolineae bacterium]|nr:hypothetical protein [Anaerolineae bacterium]